MTRVASIRNGKPYSVDYGTLSTEIRMPVDIDQEATSNNHTVAALPSRLRSFRADKREDNEAFAAAKRFFEEVGKRTGADHGDAVVVLPNFDWRSEAISILEQAPSKRLISSNERSLAHSDVMAIVEDALQPLFEMVEGLIQEHADLKLNSVLFVGRHLREPYHQRTC